MLPGFSLLQDNLRDSMEALESLRKNADSISTKLEAKTGLKRKLAAVKIIIGKESSDGLTTRLKEAIPMLGLAVQACDLTISIVTLDLIAAQVTKTLNDHFGSSKFEEKPQIEVQKQDESRGDVIEIDESQLTRIPKDNAKLNKKYTASRIGCFTMAYATTTGAWQAYLQLPSWLSSSVYELQSTPTGYGWTYNYLVYNLVSYESDIIQRIQKGDRAGVLELFGNRKASPFDKDEYGHSLLYWAATSKNFKICQLLLSLGLHEALLEKVGKTAQAGALAPPVYDPNRHHPEKIWLKIADLFQSYIDEPETSMVLRMFDYHNSCDYGNEFSNAPYLIARDLKITSFDVSESSRTEVSLMHSAAVAFGIRFADEVLPWVRGWAMWTMSPYNEGWGHLVREVASVARQEDLHIVEIVQPWDVYQVPTWKGTPLISVIGGALCYLSPDIDFTHWDDVFQGCVQKWVSILQQSGVDLMLYGEQEAISIRKHFRAAFDSDVIEASRNEVRNVLPSSSARLTFIRPERSGRKMWNSNHWIPIRLLELKFGPTPSEWEIVWVPEFEWMAKEFWQMIEKEVVIMPGPWID
ncbi:hypothetical protein FDENT_14177 [Fusarium denticulatum]|uniref:Ankyrin repeat protein n=1 Tax=Fusarium denticulatum TaxID=48507 RepID=A0A8H5SVH7_9HYPO|nr:hypothetical protein FDENT_14177 [Fusarium denticulatum]